MQFKKCKTVLAALLAGALACSAMIPTAASAAGSRTKDEAYGDSTYAQRFMSLYDDVITNGQANGYMSTSSTVDSSKGLGIPYHSVEELCIEAPDYGHETTSEALSYLVWAAAMRDNIVNKADELGVELKSGDEVGQLSKAWYTLEATMIPDSSVQVDFFSGHSKVSADYSDEWQDIESYPTSSNQDNNNNPGFAVENPIHSYFENAYSNDKGLYLMNWLADVDDWYGFGEANGSTWGQSRVSGNFTLTNSFQRGESESCWETIPHACVSLEMGGTGSTKPVTGYGVQFNGKYYGMKAFFTYNEDPSGYDRSQYSYTNAPDAEDRAIQAVYAANRWGVGDQTVDSKMSSSGNSVNALAAKMGDETRNNMYDKYYQAIGVSANFSSGQDVVNITSPQNVYNSGTNAKVGVHYLMNWYTAWGGSTYDHWVWQIGASHMHEFYQNPLAAYSLTNYSGSDGLADGMKAQGINSSAEADFEKSLETQIEFYLWLSSEEGLFAGGATNSVNGRYGAYVDNPSGTATFTAGDGTLVYVEEPVYADPGSNHWIGNQVWSAQRLAELYYVVATGQGEDPMIGETGMTLSQCLETVLDKWVAWFVNYTVLGEASGTISGTHDYDTVKDQAYTVPDLNTVTDDGVNFSIPASVVWDGEPYSWTGKYNEEDQLDCLVVGYGNGDLGCVSSLANTLIYYAAAKGVTADEISECKTIYDNNRTAVRATGASTEEPTKGNLYNTETYLSTYGDTVAEEALYLAKELLDREWNLYRDDIGLGVADCNSNLTRMWEEDLVLPSGSNWTNGRGESLSNADARFSGYMPNGDEIKNGVKFIDIRSGYKKIDMYNEAYAYYQSNGNDNNGDGTVDVSDYYFTLHRFWHEGDVMMALGAMAELYPELEPDMDYDDDSDEDDLTVSNTTIDLEVGETETIEVSGGDGNYTFTSKDSSIASVDSNGNVTGESAGSTTITVTDGSGNSVDVTVNVTETVTTTTTEATTTTTTTEITTTTSTEATTSTTPASEQVVEGDQLLGDVNLDGSITMADVVLLSKASSGGMTLNGVALLNADCFQGQNNDPETPDIADMSSLLSFIVGILTTLPEV